MTKPLRTADEIKELDTRIKTTVRDYEHYKKSVMKAAKTYLKDVKDTDLDEMARHWCSYVLVESSLKYGPIQIQEYRHSEYSYTQEGKLIEVPRREVLARL